jgi:hypothetical protein
MSNTGTSSIISGNLGTLDVISRYSYIVFVDGDNHRRYIRDLLQFPPPPGCVVIGVTCAKFDPHHIELAQKENWYVHSWAGIRANAADMRIAVLVGAIIAKCDELSLNPRMFIVSEDKVFRAVQGFADQLGRDIPLIQTDRDRQFGLWLWRELDVVIPRELRNVFTGAIYRSRLAMKRYQPHEYKNAIAEISQICKQRGVELKNVLLELSDEGYAFLGYVGGVLFMPVYWSDSLKKLVKRIHSVGKKLNPDFALSNEEISEFGNLSNVLARPDVATVLR